MSFKAIKALLFIVLFLSIKTYSINRINFSKPSDDFIKLLEKRKSKRNFINKYITVKELSYLLYSSDARTPRGNRTAPSAGALYPVDIFVYLSRVKGMKKGIYYYNPRYHYLQPFKMGNYIHKILASCYYQSAVKKAAVIFFMIYEKKRMEFKYGKRSLPFAYIEAGHISQNILLAAAKLKLGSVPIGAFKGKPILKIFNFHEKKRTLLYINLIGKIQ